MHVAFVATQFVCGCVHCFFHKDRKKQTEQASSILRRFPFSLGFGLPP